jgi:ribosomal protein L31
MCNGEEVMVTSGTKPSYTVDIWSGNHPFYQGVTTSVVTDEGRVNRFKRRFVGLDSLAKVDTMDSLKAAESK